MSPEDDLAESVRSQGSRIAVIDKAVRVLDALVQSSSGLTPTELASVLGLNRSSAFRLLTSLEQAGLLYREASTGRYRLGLKFLQYGESVRAGTVLIDVAEPTMRRLSSSTRQSVSLAVREGYGARCVHRIAGPDIESFAWKIGGWLPLHAGAAPLALLSTLPDIELRRFFAQAGQLRTLHGPLTEADVRAEIAEVRRKGFSLNRGGLTVGVSSMGAVVRNSTGAPVCAISVAGLDYHYQQDALDRTAAAVTDAVAELGRLLS